MQFSQWRALVGWLCVCLSVHIFIFAAVIVAAAKVFVLGPSRVRVEWCRVRVSSIELGTGNWELGVEVGSWAIRVQVQAQVHPFSPAGYV